MITKQQHDDARALLEQMANKPGAAGIMNAAKYRDKAWGAAGIKLTKSMDLYRTAHKTAGVCVYKPCMM